MLVTFRKESIKVDSNVIISWREVQTEIVVKTLNANKRRNKLISSILKDRKRIESLLTKTDSELNEMLVEEPSIDMDRNGMYNSHYPFTINSQ